MAEKDMITPALTVVFLAIAKVLDHRKGKTRGGALERIEKKIDDYQVETRKTCQALTLRVDQVEELAEGAMGQVMGPPPDRKNGLKSRVGELEEWRETEARRERARLEQLERDRELELRVGPDRRLSKPTDVGALTPRTV